MIDFFYLNIFFLMASFILNLCVCLSTHLMQSNSFFKLAKISDISYSMFNYCITENDTVLCSKSKLGYDNTLFLNMKQPKCLESLVNELNLVDLHTYENTIKMGNGLLLSTYMNLFTVQDLIKYTSQFNVFSFSKYKMFLEAPANNNFSHLLVFHFITCVLCVLTGLMLIVLRCALKRDNVKLFKTNKLKEVTYSKSISPILNLYLVLRFTLGVSAILTIIIDCLLFSPFLSLLGSLTISASLILLILQFLTMPYFVRLSRDFESRANKD